MISLWAPVQGVKCKDCPQEDERISGVYGAGIFAGSLKLHEEWAQYEEQNVRVPFGKMKDFRCVRR